MPLKLSYSYSSLDNQPHFRYLILYYHSSQYKVSFLLSPLFLTIQKAEKAQSSTTSKITMATASVTMPLATFTVASATVGSARRRKNNVHYITGLNSFGGLKAQNSVTSLGLPDCTEQCFAKVVSSLKFPGKGKGGGALSSTCNAVGEIFRIAAIMNGLVLIGVAVGFVLLRIEASLEEAD